MTRPIHHLRRHRRRRQVDAHRARCRPGCGARGHEVLLTREPGGSAAGRAVARAGAAPADGCAERDAADLRRAPRPPAAAASSRRWRAAPSCCATASPMPPSPTRARGRGFDLERAGAAGELGAARPPARSDAVVRPAAAKWRPSAAPQCARRTGSSSRTRPSSRACAKATRSAWRRRRSASCAWMRRPTARPSGRRSNRRWSSGRGGRRGRPPAVALAGGAAAPGAAAAARRMRCCCRPPQGIGALEFMLTLAQAWLCEAADDGAALRALRQLPAGAVRLAPGPAPAAARDRCVRCSAARRRPTTTPARAARHGKQAQPADPHRRGARRHRLGGADARRAGGPRWCCCTRPRP